MIVIYHADVLCRVFCAQTHLIPCALGSACVSNDGHLASIHSANQSEFLWDLILANNIHPNTSSRIWIGLHDQKDDGMWVWSDGTPVNYWASHLITNLSENYMK